MATSFSSWADLGKGEEESPGALGRLPGTGAPTQLCPEQLLAASSPLQPRRSWNILTRRGKERQRQNPFKQEPQRLAATDCGDTGTSGRVRPQTRPSRNEPSPISPGSTWIPAGWNESNTTGRSGCSRGSPNWAGPAPSSQPAAGPLEVSGQPSSGAPDLLEQGKTAGGIWRLVSSWEQGAVLQAGEQARPAQECAVMPQRADTPTQRRGLALALAAEPEAKPHRSCSASLSPSTLLSLASSASPSFIFSSKLLCSCGRARGRVTRTEAASRNTCSSAPAAQQQTASARGARRAWLGLPAPSAGCFHEP